MTATDCNSTSRPWYKPHLTTAIAVLAVGAVLICSQLESGGGVVNVGNGRFTTPYHQGWPAISRCSIVTEAFDYDPNTQQLTIIPLGTNSRWIMSGLLINVIASLLMIASTAVVCERWRRRHTRPWQFSLRSLLILTATTAILLYLYRDERDIAWWLGIVADENWHFSSYGLRFSPWYVITSMTFGIGCVIFMMLSIALFATSTLIRVINDWRLSARKRPTT